MILMASRPKVAEGSADIDSGLALVIWLRKSGAPSEAREMARAVAPTCLASPMGAIGKLMLAAQTACRPLELVAAIRIGVGKYQPPAPSIPGFTLLII
jgi:hypothetical protein